MQKRSITAAALAATTVLATALASTAAASATPAAKAVPNTKPAWIAHATHLGSAASSATVSARVYLAPQGGLAAVKQAAIAMATPGSASYHKFLTTAQYRARFGTTDATVRSVSAYLRTAGLTVSGVGASNRYLTVTGTVSGAEKAFGAQIERYRHNGTAVQAPASALKVPADIAASVLTVTGLDTSVHKAAPVGAKARPVAGFRNAPPCSTFYGEKSAQFKADGTTPLPKFMGNTVPYAPCGYVGSQFRGAYEGGSLLTGSGVTVAITDAYASATMQADAIEYAGRNGDAAYGSGQLVEVDATRFTHKHQCDPAGWSGEEALDVEAVHAMAQGANIRYYGAASCFDSDLLDSLAQVVDDNVAQLVTNSWGDIEANETADNTAAYEAIFLQGAAQGISFMFSSGDNGDELANTGTVQTDYPTSDPYVTAVGGTSTAINSSNALAWQTGWGTEKYALSASGTSWDVAIPFQYGAGGGQSGLFAQPDYQAGTTPGTQRAVPDVAMDADPTTGMLVGQTQTFPKGKVMYDQYRIGGTSLASPLFAGMTALALQNAGGGAGLLNPAIYTHAGAFTDVTGDGPDAGNVRVDYVNGVDASAGVVYSLRTFNQDSSLTVTPGWDDVTGLGSPNTGWFSALS